MASRGGIRAHGSDGGDFVHRERVASHYQLSFQYKSYFKITVFVHFLSFCFLFTKLASEMLEHLGYDTSVMYNTKFPRSLLWEKIWPLSFAFAAYALFGIRRNNVTTMVISAWGILVFGVLPIIYACKYYSNDMLNFLQSYFDENQVPKKSVMPIAVIWYGFITITFPVHMLSILFALKLIRAWRPKATKKTKDQ